MRSASFGEGLLSGPPYWLIRDGVRGAGTWDFEALSVEFEGERTLTVFTDEGQAEMFAWLAVIEGASRTVQGGPEGRFGTRDMQPKSCGGGELVSLLAGESGRGPCAGVRRVALDPPPELLFIGELDGLNVEIPCVSRDEFAERIIEWGGARFDTTEAAEQTTGRTIERIVESVAERAAERAAERSVEPEKG